ncbi:MAG: hypothetical protein JXR70_02350 [Spirochaetales bacterium]|nr:hypothetical protein [Spirochaetales bacterium]
MISIQDLTIWLTSFHIPILVALILIPIAAFLNGQVFIKGLKKNKGGAVIYSILTYLTVIPGICASITIAYLLFFTRVNLVQQLDVIIHIGPVLSMIATLTITGHFMDFAIIPGFHRLSGLMLVTGASFVFVLILHRMRILIGFFAGAEVLAIIFIVVFLLFKFGWENLIGKKRK